MAERCVQGIGTSLAAKSQGWKTEQAGVVAAYDLCGSASWENLARRRDSRCNWTSQKRILLTTNVRDVFRSCHVVGLFAAVRHHVPPFFPLATLVSEAAASSKLEGADS